MNDVLLPETDDDWQAPCVPIISACDQTLVRCAIGAGVDRAAQKRNLTALYEAGAISGAVLHGAIFMHELGDA